MFKVINVVVVLSFCTIIHAISLDQFIRLTQGNANLDEISELTERLRENRGDIEVRQADTPAVAAPAPATTPAASSSNLSPLISGVISAFGSMFSQNLGPLKPIADAVGPLLNSAFTGIITNALGVLVGVLKSNDLPNSGYDTYMVNIPNQGSYIILAKSQEKEKEAAPAPAPVETNTQIKLSELIANAVHESQLSQIGTKTPLTAAAIGAASLIKKKPLLIPLSVLTALDGLKTLPKNQKAYSDYEIILDEN